MLRAEHYNVAESLLAEGADVVKRIGLVDKMRGQVDRELQHEMYDRYTESMDELGKKAMGIWAQAQAHALLAQTDAGNSGIS